MTSTDFLSGVRTAADLATAATMQMHSHNSKNGSPTHNMRGVGSYKVANINRRWYHSMLRCCNSHCIHGVVGQVREEGHGQASLEDVKVGTEFPLPAAEIGDSDHLLSVGLAGQG